MGTQIAVAAGGRLPELLSQGKTPSLPAWAKPLQSALAINLQKTDKGFGDVLTLPASMIPTAAQRVEIETYLRSLNSCLTETPESRPEYAIKIAGTTSKLLLVLGGQKNELAAEAKGEAYVASLEDVPWWAVEAAARAWYRGEARNEKGERYDFSWAPDPATLRRLAMLHVWKLRGEAKIAQNLLDAQPYADCSEELTRGDLAMKGLFKAMKDGPEAMRKLTIESAVDKGKTQTGATNADCG